MKKRFITQGQVPIASWKTGFQQLQLDEIQTNAGVQVCNAGPRGYSITPHKYPMADTVSPVNVKRL